MVNVIGQKIDFSKSMTTNHFKSLNKLNLRKLGIITIRYEVGIKCTHMQ